MLREHRCRQHHAAPACGRRRQREIAPHRHDGIAQDHGVVRGRRNSRGDRNGFGEPHRRAGADASTRRPVRNWRLGRPRRISSTSLPTTHSSAISSSVTEPLLRLTRRASEPHSILASSSSMRLRHDTSVTCRTAASYGGKDDRATVEAGPSSCDLADDGACLRDRGCANACHFRGQDDFDAHRLVGRRWHRPDRPSARAVPHQVSARKSGGRRPGTCLARRAWSH